MDKLWTMQEVASAIGAELRSEWEAGGVSIDTRTIREGDIFVALRGGNFDGHDYVTQAFEKGAAAAIVMRDMIDEIDHEKCLRVEDTEVALQQLGVAARARSNAKFVGVTGSVGKTGCKEMLSCALGSLGETYATKGNYNNHLGVPLTLANMPKTTEFSVIEMGMNHAGEISQLSEWAKPDVSIITTIDAVHIEHFDSVEGIAAAKAEIFDGMGGEGVAILNADNEYFDQLKNAAEAKGLDRVISFGSDDGALCQMKSYHVADRDATISSEVHAVIAGTRISYSLSAIGKHWGLMSVAVLGAVDALGGDVAKSAATLYGFEEPAGRGKIEELKVKGGSLKLIDDSYNASPVSMEAAFEKLYTLKMQEKGCRTVAILGDMLELGEQAQEMHLALVPALINNQVDLVFAAGEMMEGMYNTLPDDMRGAYDSTASGLAPKAVAQLKHLDIVLVKGSNGSRMREVVQAIDAAAGEE
jgi:UDP-N-acetylmuramoyl-tripeptide--D-alanyl-D-alanine ligase